jgi:hypothetical protein
MFRFSHVARSIGALTFAAGILSCGSDNNRVLGPENDPGSIFDRYVSLGNSITAGYQSGGINDSTQRRSYAYLVAAQMGTGFIYPALAGRGCAPPIVNFLTQARAGTGSTGATCDLRLPSFTDLLNNVAVPGALAADLTEPARTATTPNVPSPHIHASLFLGGKSQVQKALDNDPTFASIWIGNNDILLSAVTGALSPIPGVSLGVTPTASFTASYDAGTDALMAGAPGLKGLLVGVANVNNIPALFPTDSLRNNATFRAQFDAAAGRVAASTDPFKAAALVIDPNCTAATATKVSILLAGQIAAFRNDTNPTGQAPKPAAQRRGHPGYIACGVSSTPGAPGFPVGELFILTAAEQATLTTAFTEYNNYIQAEATALDWAYLNPNVILDSLRTAGQVPARPNLTSATAPFGTWFSLDGFHPSTLAHRAIANHVIDAINAKYGTTLVRVSVP